jgi:hypothetical protein
MKIPIIHVAYVWMHVLGLCLSNHVVHAKRRGLKGESLRQHALDLGSSTSTSTPHDRSLQLWPKLLDKWWAVKKKLDVFDDLFLDELLNPPSTVPSNVPSSPPSDVPSSPPSAVPTTASMVPSFAPFSWNDVLGDASSDNDFQACPTDPNPVDQSRSTELSVLYSYRVELTPAARVLEVVRDIEDRLQDVLIGTVCTTKTSTMAISANPVDIPGGT